MLDVLRIPGLGRLAGRRFAPLDALLRIDAAYRERRRLEELTPEQLRDVGLTQDDIDRILDRG